MTTAQSHDAYFASRFTPDPKRTVVWREIARYLQRYVPQAGALLELGAGYCDFINQIQAAKKCAVDLGTVSQRAAAEGIQVLQRSVTDLTPVATESQDVVFSSNLFEHLDRADFEACIAEVRRVLVPGGRLIVIQPNFKYCAPDYFDDYTHRQIFTHVTMSDWLTALGFEVEAVRPRFLPFSMKSRLPTWGWLVRLFLAAPPNPLGKQFLVVCRKPAQGGALQSISINEMER